MFSFQDNLFRLTLEITDTFFLATQRISMKPGARGNPPEKRTRVTMETEANEFGDLPAFGQICESGGSELTCRA